MKSVQKMFYAYDLCNRLNEGKNYEWRIIKNYYENYVISKLFDIFKTPNNWRAKVKYN